MKKLIALIFLTVLAGCSYLPDDLTDFGNGHESRVEALEKKASAVDIPTIEGSLKDSAEHSMQKGDYIKAEANYKQLVDRFPENAEYQYKFAETHRRMGDCQTALSTYKALLDKDPNNLDYQESKGLCLVSQTNFAEAGPILTHIIETDGKRWKSINGAGLIFAANKKYQEANQYFDLAADLSGHNPSVLNNQGLVRALVGNYDDAINILSDASQRSDPGSFQKRQIDLNLASIYAMNKNMEMAERIARPNLTEPQLYNNLGVYAELAKDKELARTYLDKALMHTPVYYDRAWENLEKLKN